MTQTLKLAEDLFDQLLLGEKHSTIRVGKRDIVPGPILFESAEVGRMTNSVVEDVYTKKVGDLHIMEARDEGYETVDQLVQVLRRFYPDLTDETDITVVLLELPYGRVHGAAAQA